MLVCCSLIGGRGRREVRNRKEAQTLTREHSKLQFKSKPGNLRLRVGGEGKPARCPRTCARGTEAAQSRDPPRPGPRSAPARPGGPAARPDARAAAALTA